MGELRGIRNPKTDEEWIKFKEKYKQLKTVISMEMS